MNNSNYIYPLWEIDNIIKNIKPLNYECIGTEMWFNYHKQLIELNQQSTYEISNMREEIIKEYFLNYDKIHILIYDAIQISIWKQIIFPLLIELNGIPTNTFMLYSIFYHENIAVSLMKNILYHRDSLESLNDNAIDLIDYSVNNITDIIFINESINIKSSDNLSINDELIVKKYDIEFNIAIMSICIIGYFSSCIDTMPISILKRLLITHDIPYLFIQLIDKRPWIKKNSTGDIMIYNTSWEKLMDNNDDKICNVEGQVWIGLRELLLNPKCSSYYQITEFRLSQLNKLHTQLNENILDQISPLIDLRRWLNYLNIYRSPAHSESIISIEIIPQIRSSIMDKYRNKWKKLAILQAKSLYRKDMEYVQSIAKILSLAYDFDKMNISDKKLCINCNDTATKRCSKCKSVWYCGRECQVKNWPSHKIKCEIIL